MNNRILITYATRAGSTPEVALAVAEVIRKRGFAVDVKPVKEKPALAGYQAVLMGSPIRISSWLPEAVDYIRANRQALSQVPVALFTLHTLNTGDDESSRAARLAYLDKVRPLLNKAEEVYFSGKIDYATLPFLDRLMAKAVEKQTGTPPGDFRDWNKIRSWAETIFA